MGEGDAWELSWVLETCSLCLVLWRSSLCSSWRPSVLSAWETWRLALPGRRCEGRSETWVWAGSSWCGVVAEEQKVVAGMGIN